jgi:cobalt-zinc-cadmium efflux system membrane fusion protein
VLVEVAATAKGFEYRKQNVVVVAQTSSQVQVRPGGLYPGDRVVKVGGQVLSSFFILGSLRLSKEGIRNVGLQVEPATKQVVEEVISLQGLVDLPPGRVATVSSQFAGSLNRVHVDRGERVKSGQVIAEVAGLPIQDTQLSLLRYDLEAKLLEGTIERLKSAGQVPLVAGRRIWEMESARDAVVNRRDSARQTLLTMGLSAADVDVLMKTGEPRAAIPIRAPIDGVIVHLNKVLGEGVTADEALLEIHDVSQPWVKAFQSETEAGKVRIGTPARVRLLSDPTFIAEAKVVQSARSIGMENRTLAVWLEFATPPQKTLQRNLLAEISVTVGKSSATLALPLSAIVREQTRTYVFVQKSGGLLERRGVELGRSDDRYVEITRGLTEGERVAVQGTAELQTTYASVR